MADPAAMLGSANISGILGTLGKAGSVVLWGLAAMGIVYVFIYFVKYNKKLYLLVQQGDAVRFVKDRGKADKKNKHFSALKNRDFDFPYPESKYEMVEGKGSALFAYVRNQSATWLSVSENPHFIPANYNMLNFLVNETKGAWEIVKPKANFWDKYGAQIMWIGSMGVFLIVIILILKRMDRIIAMGHSVAQAQIEAGKNVVSSLIPAVWLKRWSRK